MYGRAVQCRRVSSTFNTLCFAAFIGIGISTLVLAQDQTIERTVKGLSNKEIRIAIYINIQPECTSGPLPSIRLTSPPEHGNVTVKKTTVNATNYKKCLALQVPGFVAFYRSAPNFSGTDSVSFEVKFPGGRTEIQKFKVMVGGSGEQI
jgi:hypothetical protein